MLPTYNEVENIGSLLESLLSTYPQSHVVVVDDNSPDGTANLVRRMEKKNPHRLTLLKRGERGRGSAGIVGFTTALLTKKPILVEMDADGSHDPLELHHLLEGAAHYEVVIGSRSLPGSRDDRLLSRRLLTACANFYLSTILQLPTWDITSGFRVYRREVIESLLMHPLLSKGPSIVVEMLYLAFSEGFYIGQVPIHFRNRQQGISKLNAIILLQSLLLPFLFRFHHRV